MGALAVACGGDSIPDKVGVFVLSNRGIVEVETYGTEEVRDSIHEGLSIGFAFADQSKVPEVGSVDAFFVNMPDATISETRVFPLDSLDVRWRRKPSPADPQPFEIEIRTGSGTAYRVDSAGFTSATSRFLALRLTTRMGIPDRLYAVRLARRGATKAAPLSPEGVSGGLEWPAGLDVCPDTLFMRLTGKAIDDILPSLKPTPVVPSTSSPTMNLAPKQVRPATRADLDDLPPTWRGENIDGEMCAFARR